MAGPALSVLDLITEVLSLLGTYSPGDPIAAADADTLLFTLNGIIDGYGAEALTITSTVPLTFTTIAGKASYTLGADPSNDWVIASGVLPPEITQYGAQIGGNFETSLVPLTDAQWAAVGLKSLGSTFAVNVWVNYGATSHTIKIWPVPAGVAPIILYCPQPVAKFASISDAVSLRPGYQELLTFELTIKGAPKFKRPVPDWIPEAWADAKAKIKAANVQALDMRCDDALTNGGGGRGLIAFYEGR